MTFFYQQIRNTVLTRANLANNSSLINEDLEDNSKVIINILLKYNGLCMFDIYFA